MHTISVETDRQQVEDFLYHEANLLDDFKLNDWIDLFTQDATYWVPADTASDDPKNGLSIIIENREKLADRVFLNQSPHRWCNQPGAKTSRLLSNVQITRIDDQTVRASSRFVLYELRRGVQTEFIGRYEHHLRNVDGQWKIAFKRVDLLNNIAMLPSIIFLL